MDDQEKPTYVTRVSALNTMDGYWENKATGKIVKEVGTWSIRTLMRNKMEEMLIDVDVEDGPQD